MVQGAHKKVLNFPTADKIKFFSEQALQRIADDRLLPTPRVYEVLYVYYSGENAQITRSIDMLESKKKVLTNELCNDLWRAHLSEEKTNAKIRQAGDQIQTTIHDVSNVMGGVKTATSQYGSNISALSGSLSMDMSPGEIEKIVSSIQSGTSDMMQKNMQLEEELNRSNQMMEELRKDLENVRKEAMTDSLTGLGNRKSFDNKLKDVHEHMIADKSTYSLIMLDIDHFKSFNDDFGHQVGDQVLRLVSRTLINGVKGRDIACRYGGEEFAIILPDTNGDATVRVANHLREAVASKDIVNRSTGEKLARITLSAGVAEWDGDETVENLILRADRALYAAKNNGRNQVILADIDDLAEESFKA